MSMTFFGDDPEGRYSYEITVDDPGHGTLVVLYRGLWDEWDRNISGRELGHLLNDLTSRAIGTDNAESAAPRVLPRHIDSRTAQEMLPAF